MKTLSKIQITFLALALMVTIPFTSYAVDGKIKIGQIATTTFPIVIDQPGSYVLTSNFTVTTPGYNCITIDADNVTLDLNGFALVGPGTGTGGGNGISANDKRNITIKNGTIRNFLAGAIYLWTTTPTTITHHNHQVTDVKVYNNGGGITAYGATIANCVSAGTAGDGMKVTNCSVKDCTVNNNGGGFESEGSTIINCTARNNTGNGINATNSTIINCTSNDNGMNGIEADHSTIINCTANGSQSGNGILATNCSIADCTTKSNNVDGIHADFSSITNCVANENNEDGIEASDSTVTNSTAYGNSPSPEYNTYGIYANNSKLTDCTSNGNYDGIYVLRSVVTNCTASNNESTGFTVYYSTITNCTASNSNLAGFYAQNSTITNCTAYENVGDGFFTYNATITNCTSQHNDNIGIRAGASSGINRIEGNNVSNNVSYGIQAFSNNYIIKNTARGNASGNFQDSGTNTYMPICGVDATDNCNFGW